MSWSSWSNCLNRRCSRRLKQQGADLVADRAGPGHLRPEVEHTVLGPLSLAPQGCIEPRPAIRVDLASELAAHHMFALRTELDRH